MEVTNRTDEQGSEGKGNPCSGSGDGKCAKVETGEVEFPFLKIESSELKGRLVSVGVGEEVKALVAKPDDMSSVLIWWKERAHSSMLSSDLHMHTVICPTHAHK